MKLVLSRQVIHDESRFPFKVPCSPTISSSSSSLVDFDSQILSTRIMLVVLPRHSNEYEEQFSVNQMCS